jgi:hypothetical protein
MSYNDAYGGGSGNAQRSGHVHKRPRAAGHERIQLLRDMLNKVADAPRT